LVSTAMLRLKKPHLQHSLLLWIGFAIIQSITGLPAH